MSTKKIVSLSLLFLLGNSYLSAMNTEITESSIKAAKVAVKEIYSTWVKCGSDCKHNIEPFQISLKKNKINVKCKNRGVTLVIKKKNISGRDYIIINRKFPRDSGKLTSLPPIYSFHENFFNHFNVLQKLYQQREKDKTLLTFLSLCRNSKTE